MNIKKVWLAIICVCVLGVGVMCMITQNENNKSFSDQLNECNQTNYGVAISLQGKYNSKNNALVFAGVFSLIILVFLIAYQTVFWKQI